MQTRQNHKTPLQADTPRVFDRARIRQARNRSAAMLHEHNFLTEWTIKNLSDRLRDIKRDFPLALQIGGRTTAEQDSAIKETGGIETLCHMDIAENLLRRKEGEAVLLADEEFLPVARNSLDLVISPLSLHSVNDLPGALIQINYALKPDGLFLAAMLGGETLYELRQVMMQAEKNIKGGISPRIAPFADKPQMGALLQRAGFALPVVDSDILHVTYDNLYDLMRDLRGMGENNAIDARSRHFTSRSVMEEAARLYREQYSDEDGRLTASFEIIFLIGWAPHESQQKPLKPGSADHKLAEALEATEHKAGEEAAP